MSLSQTTLNFGIGTLGTVTPGGPTGNIVVTSPQTIVIAFGGASVGWTASSNQSNVVVSPASGTGAGSFQVTATACPVFGVPCNAIITVNAPAASNPTLQIQVTVSPLLQASPPFGSFDTPVNNSAGLSGRVGVTGWTLDTVEVVKVDIWREKVGNEPVAANGYVYIGDALFVAGARPDVQTAYPTAPLNYRAGWGYLMVTNGLPNNGGKPGPGNGTYKLHAFAHNKSGVAVDLGTRTITVDNADSIKPFGTLDTPGLGDTVSGTITVFGWALTPQPAMIPSDGSTIWVGVDGQLLGHPVYGQARIDIQTGFPGYANSNGAVGYYFLDTTKLTNGVHNLGWPVTDNAGRTDGVGSRFITVLN